MSHRKAVLASVAAGVLASAAIGALAVGGVAAVATPAAAATTGCSVAYQNLNAWQSSPARDAVGPGSRTTYGRPIVSSNRPRIAAHDRRSVGAW